MHLKEAIYKKLKGAAYLLLICAASSLSVIFLYCANVSEMRLSETFPSLCVYITMGLCIGALFLWYTKRPAVTLILVLISGIFFSNFKAAEDIIYSIFPFVKYWHFLIASVVLLGHMAYFAKRIPRELDEYIMSIGAIFIVVLCGINMIPAIVKNVSQASQNTSEDIAITSQNVSAPNVYYFILDEYSSLYVMNKYYNFENTEFENFLKDNDFEINYTGKNESYETNTVTTNYMNLEYCANDAMSVYDRQTLRYQGKLTTLLKNYGYEIIGCGNSDFLGIDSIHKQSEAATGTTIDGLSFTQIVLKQSVLYPFITENSDADISLIRNTFSYFKNAEKNLSNYHENTAFITYLKTPHQPFYFKEDGSINDFVDFNNWDDKQFYLGQYKYVTNEMMDCLEAILKNDPTGIIIVQSDHGARTNIPIEDKVRPFQTVRFPTHQYESIEGLSGVNVLRRVFGELLGIDLPILEDPK